MIPPPARDSSDIDLYTSKRSHVGQRRGLASREGDQRRRGWMHGHICVQSYEVDRLVLSKGWLTGERQEVAQEADTKDLSRESCRQTCIVLCIG